jgi:hypothetical protein
MAAQDYEQVTYNAPGGAQIGKSASEKIGFYGATPVVQRATASTHTTTNVVTSASYGTLQVAQMQEVQNTLIALGIWAA